MPETSLLSVYEGLTLYGPYRIEYEPGCKTLFSMYLATLKAVMQDDFFTERLLELIIPIMFAPLERLAVEVADEVEKLVQPGSCMIILCNRECLTTIIRGEFMQDWDAKLEVYEQIKLRRMLDE